MSKLNGTAQAKNVLGGALATCGTDPTTGFYRDGCCNTGPQDAGTHTVCAVMTDEFLRFTANRGNDLSTPRPEFDFPGLKPGDRWCLCAGRWAEAEAAGVAPPVVLDATHEATGEAGRPRQAQGPRRLGWAAMATTWFEIARAYRRAALTLARDGLDRPCVSAAYYAAYARVTHELVVTAGLTMPTGREGPSHPGSTPGRAARRGGIRRMIEAAMPGLDLAARQNLSQIVGELYDARILADYCPSQDLGPAEVRDSLAAMETVFDAF